MGEIRPLSTLVIKDLMFETLKDKEFALSKTEHSFEEGAAEDTLYWIMELKAIDKGLIEENREVQESAWYATRMLVTEYSSNFRIEEVERMNEAFYLFLNRGIIAPGVHGLSSALPFFHITDHGKKCIEEKDILPYDIDGFTKKIKSINNIDEWVEFYLLEALKCYNANCYNATTVMIGLTSEKLIELLIESISNLLARKIYKYKDNSKKGLDLKKDFDSEIDNKKNISQKFTFIEDFIIKVIDINAKKEIENVLNRNIDKPARSSFVNFIRLNRNEVSHCADIKKDATETMLLFISFLKYCEKMSNAINDINNIK
ncbi:hypothetical protein KQI30_13530 [Clostridium bornimense]|uniref:hypothetical protein n=1 Tax=Clostridium bornimense TaxID=1216932 RepID=UPI001C1088E5|nr:hypothetical protein [Clostridium bornimense]MBU5317272.1 hypothetical protein [Clostridium bornimense]